MLYRDPTRRIYDHRSCCIASHRHLIGGNARAHPTLGLACHVCSAAVPPPLAPTIKMGLVRAIPLEHHQAVAQLQKLSSVRAALGEKAKGSDPVHGSVESGPVHLELQRCAVADRE